MHNIDYVFLADVLLYALNSFDDLQDTLSDDEYTNEQKLKYIAEICDDFIEFADLKKEELQATQQRMEMLSILS